MAGIGSVISDLFGEEKMARQFFVWTIASAVVNQLLGPYLTAMGSAVNSFSPEAVIPPADLADMVTRGIINQNDGSTWAKKSGVSEFDFDLFVRNTGEPPSTMDMLQLYRRGEVTHDEVVRAIKQSRVKDEWIDTVLKLGKQYPTPADILDSIVKGQIDHTAGEALYGKLGGADEYYQLMLDTVGEGPTPDQAAAMANKGIIPWTGTGPQAVTFEQAFLESHYRNKWLDAYRKNAQYFPPPRTITAMHTAGTLSDADAARLLREQGLDDALVAAYLKTSSATKKTKAKDLAESTIQTLYMSHSISDQQARDFLIQLKFNADDANFTISAWLLARELSARNTAIGTIHSNFVGHKIDANKASNLLDGIGVPSQQRDYLLKTWNEEKQAKVTLLTAAEIKKAMKESLLSADDAFARLVDRGYSEDDATIYLAL